MSNYSSYIHVSRLWPARPTISPIDAEWEHRACQRRRLGRWRGPFWHVIHHRFHLTAAAVSPSLSQTADLAEDTWEDGQTPLWDRWPADERAEKPSVILYSGDIFIDTERFRQSGGVLAGRLAVHRG